MPDEVHVEVDSGCAHCPRTRMSTGDGLVFWGKHLLDCQQQHTVSLSSAEAELYEVVNGAARGLFIRNVLEAMELQAVVRVGRQLELLRGMAQGRVRHLEVKELWIQDNGQVA